MTNPAHGFGWGEESTLSDPSAESRIGMRIGPYLLKRLLGRGGMGEVYVAEDTVRGRTVALKLMTPAYSDDPVFRKRLQREARSAGKLHEPHVVPIHDFGEIEGQLFVDMRLIDGVDLAALLGRDGPIAPARAVAIVRQIASALDAAHGEGVMHRDVKPGNILISGDDFAYLVDFGIASAAKGEEKLTRRGEVIGTFAYMPPERLTGDEDKITHRADIYALTCVLYECLTGSCPYRGSAASMITAHITHPIPRPSEVRPGIPKSFDDVIARGMAKDPDDRYATAGDLATDALRGLTTPDQDRAVDILNRNKTTVVRSDYADSSPRLPAAPPAAPPTARSSGPGGWITPSTYAAPPGGQRPPPYTARPAAFAGQLPQTHGHVPQIGTSWQSPGPPPQPSAPAWDQSSPPSGRSSKNWIFAGVAAIAVVALVVGGIAIVSGGDDPRTDIPGQVAIPIQVLDDSVEVGSSSAPVSIDIFDEPICPQCGSFISSSAADLSKAVEDEKLAIRYHLVNFLDGESASGNYSTRAIAASLCVADANDGKLYMDFYHGIFAPDFQPREKAVSDRNDSDLADLAEGLGAPPEVRTCIENDEKRSDAKSVAARAQTGLDSLNEGTTPAAFENDVPVDIDRRNWVEALG